MADRINQINQSSWERAKIYASGFAEGFKEYYVEKYKGTQSVSDAISRTDNILDEGFSMMDEYNPITYVKKPIKEWSSDVAKSLSDGDPNHLSMAERTWAVAEGFGSVADNLTSTKGITAICLTAGTFGMLGGAVAGTSATAATTVKVGSTVAGEVIGGILVSRGVYDAVTAKNESEAKKGGVRIGSGVIALGTAAATAKDSLRTALASGIETKNPYLISTPTAMAENIRILPQVAAAQGKEIATATRGLLAGASANSSTTAIKTNVTAPQAASAKVQTNGFTVKPKLQNKFDAEIAEMAADKEPLGWSSGLKDMKKIMAGLDKLASEGNMTPQGYAQMAKTVAPDLPGQYWNKAIKMYLEYGANANKPQVMNAVQGYLSGVTTVNGGSNLYRAQAARGTTEYITLAASVTSAGMDKKENTNTEIQAVQDNSLEEMINAPLQKFEPKFW